MDQLNNYVVTYKEHLRTGVIQKAYCVLLKYVMSLKAHLSDKLSNSFSFGNLSPGYMDFSYFPFFNDYLRERKLRFGIVLNHEQMRFELWLMGKNVDTQKRYWAVLKSTPWNQHLTAMPRYTVLEVVLVHNPDFNDLDMLSLKIETAAVSLSEQIIEYLKNNEIPH